MDEGVYMTHSNIKRQQICLKIVEKHISQIKAAQELNVVVLRKFRTLAI